ncbi:MAG: hypothetical protein Q8930_04115 [Bacillota bacterium]|nr:hypothetical protein [Bacillota bacterium]
MYYMYSFYGHNSFPITLTTFIVLTVLCFLLGIKKGASAGMIAILILLLGYVVQIITYHFTMGLNRIGWRLQGIMNDAFDIIVAVVIFIIIAAILSFFSSLVRRKRE